MLLAGRNLTGAALGIACLFPLVGVALLVFGVLTLLLLLRLRKALAEQAQLARASWAAQVLPKAAPS